VISDAVRNDPEVADLLEDEGYLSQRFASALKGFDDAGHFDLWRVSLAEVKLGTQTVNQVAP
jgi:hypothetical protein